MTLQDLGLDVGAVLGEGVELGDVLGEVVIQLGQLDVGDGLQGDLEGSGLTGQLSGVVLLGEGDVHVELLTDLVADDLILEAGDEGAGAQLQVVVLALAALESDAVDEALEVDLGGVAVLGGSLIGDLGLAGVALADDLDLVVDLDLGCGLDHLGGLDALVALDLHGGLHGNGSGEGDAVVVDVGDIEFGAAHGLHTGLGQSGLIGLGKHLVSGILPENALTVHTLDDGAGSLTLTEAGDVDLAHLLTVYLAYGLVEGLLIHGELNEHCALLGLFCFDQVHG